MSEWEDVREVKWVNAEVERCMPYNNIRKVRSSHVDNIYIRNVLKIVCIKSLLKVIF